MKKNAFIDFIENDEQAFEGVYFWQRGWPSRYMDALLMNKSMRKAMTSSSVSKALVTYISHKIANSYANIVHSTTLHAFKGLTVHDFLNTSGFAKADKASATQSAYFENFAKLSDFVKYDILFHDNTEAQLNALRRWIDVANILLERRCFEGVNIVISTLNSAEINKLKLVSHLPSNYQDKFAIFTDLINPSQNYSNLRKAQSECNEGYVPVLNVIVRDLTYIDPQLEKMEFTPSGRMKNITPMLPLLRKKLAIFDELDNLQQQSVKILSNGEYATYNDYQANQVSKDVLWEKAVECSMRIENESKPKLFKEIKSSLFFRCKKGKKCMEELQNIIGQNINYD